MYTGVLVLKVSFSKQLPTDGLWSSVFMPT